MANKQKFKSKLTIVSQRELSTFKNKKGEETVIYEVEAVDEQGKPVDKPLRTFHEALPTGELIEFDVDIYDHEDFGRTYTLKLPAKGRASKKDISQLQAQYTGVADRVAALEGDVTELRAEIAKLRGLRAPGKEEKPF